MAVGDRQKLITNIIGLVLECEPDKIKFDWLKNKHMEADFQEHYDSIKGIFQILNGNQSEQQNKKIVFLDCDAFFGGVYNFMFEYDEFQHFSTSRLLSLESYPQNIKLGFDLDYYKNLCLSQKERADKYRKNKTTKDFPFSGGRTAQRAYLDSFKDILPNLQGLKPTIRISEFEVKSITINDNESRKLIEEILKKIF